MARSTDEWRGSSDDAAIPPHVKLRIWNREKGICHISGRKIMPSDAYDFDHKVALCNGGEHREFNIFPALRDKHREKTARDRDEKKRIDDKRSKHLGIRARKGPPMPGSRGSRWKRTMDGRTVLR